MKTYVGDKPVTFKGPAVRGSRRAARRKVIGTLAVEVGATAPREFPAW